MHQTILRFVKVDNIPRTNWQLGVVVHSTVNGVVKAPEGWGLTITHLLEDTLK